MERRGSFYYVTNKQFNLRSLLFVNASLQQFLDFHCRDHSWLFVLVTFGLFNSVVVALVSC